MTQGVPNAAPAHLLVSSPEETPTSCSLSVSVVGLGVGIERMAVQPNSATETRVSKLTLKPNTCSLALKDQQQVRHCHQCYVLATTPASNSCDAARSTVCAVCL